MVPLRSRIDPDRLRRAFRLKVDKLGSGSWQVNGRVIDPEHGCACPDRMLRGTVCKHEIAVRLDALDEELREALAALHAPVESAPSKQGGG